MGFNPRIKKPQINTKDMVLELINFTLLTPNRVDIFYRRETPRNAEVNSYTVKTVLIRVHLLQKLPKIISAHPCVPQRFKIFCYGKMRKTLKESSSVVKIVFIRVHQW